MRHISVAELKDYLGTYSSNDSVDGDRIDSNGAARPLLLDVREPWEYQICHLNDSMLVPMNQVPAILKKLDKDQETIIICHHGVRSQRVGLLMKDNGFKDIVNVAGGINAWAKNVDSSMSTY